VQRLAVDRNHLPSQHVRAKVHDLQAFEFTDKAVWDEVHGWSHGGAPLWWLNGAGGLVPALVPWPAGLSAAPPVRARSPPCWVRRGALLWWVARGLRLEVR
jgi:hypothetical protein